MAKSFRVKIDKTCKAWIHFPALSVLAVNPRNFLEELILSLPSYKQLGFLKPDYLRDNLKSHVLGDTKDSIKPIWMNAAGTANIISRSLEAAYSKLPFAGSVEVYVLPTYNSFITRKMGGVSGFTPGKRVIFIYLNPSGKWRRRLAETAAHEFVHTISYKNHKWQTLLDTIIFEGLAEVFTSKVLKFPASPWSKALGREQAKTIVRKIKPVLKSKNQKEYQRVFFDNKEFPLWTGYALGSHIVREFIKNNGEGWNDLLKLKPAAVLKKSRFLE